MSDDDSVEGQVQDRAWWRRRSWWGPRSSIRPDWADAQPPDRRKLMERRCSGCALRRGTYAWTCENTQADLEDTQAAFRCHKAIGLARCAGAVGKWGTERQVAEMLCSPSPVVEAFIAVGEAGVCGHAHPTLAEAAECARTSPERRVVAAGILPDDDGNPSHWNILTASQVEDLRALVPEEDILPSYYSAVHYGRACEHVHWTFLSAFNCSIDQGAITVDELLLMPKGWREHGGEGAWGDPFDWPSDWESWGFTQEEGRKLEAEMDAEWIAAGYGTPAKTSQRGKRGPVIVSSKESPMPQGPRRLDTANASVLPAALKKYAADLPADPLGCKSWASIRDYKVSRVKNGAVRLDDGIGTVVYCYLGARISKQGRAWHVDRPDAAALGLPHQRYTALWRAVEAIHQAWTGAGR